MINPTQLHIRRATPVAPRRLNKRRVRRGRRRPRHLWPLEPIKVLRRLTSQTPSELDKSDPRGTDSGQKTGIRLQRGPETPKTQEDHHCEYDADRNSRPQFTAKQCCFETEGCEKRYHATGQQRQTGESRDHLRYRDLRPEQQRIR